MNDPTLPCIVCDKPLKCAFPEEIWADRPVGNQPNDATAFYSFGHYGSTFWDPMDGTRIEINICDDCLTKKKDKIIFPIEYKSDIEDQE